MYAIANGDHKSIRDLSVALKPMAEYDLSASFAMASSLEALGMYGDAIQAFEWTMQLDRYFRPAQMRLAENLLVAKRFDEALVILLKSHAALPHSVSRKVMIALALCSRGEHGAADQQLAAGESFDAASIQQ